jgi:cell wall-associated NlpC family hydrolase
MRIGMALALCGLVLSGCASYPFDTPEMRDSIKRTALAQVGRPYRTGGSSPAGFDCSGLAQYVFGRNGVHLPRTSDDQRDVGEDDIDFEDAEAGDLLFYKVDSWFGVDHVAIYIGDGFAVHAPVSGRQVVVTDMTTEFWQDHFVEAVNVLRQ